MRLLLTPLLLLFACKPDVAPGVCTDAVPAPMAGCFSAPGLTPAEDGSITGSVVGTVQSVDVAPLPSDCTSYFGGDAGPTSFAMQVLDDGGVVTLLGLGGFAPPAAVGDAITLDLAYDVSSWGPEQAGVSIRDASGGQRLVYADGGSVDDLAAPDGVELAMGATMCTQTD